VRIEAGRATGVEVRTLDGQREFHRARREVILCAGAIESPKLLMLSGIGPGAALQELGIPVERNLPGVGQNLQDHLMIRFQFRTKPARTLNEYMANPARKAMMGLDWGLRRRGPMTIGASEVSLFARVLPGAEEPDVQYQFVNFSLISLQAGLHKHPGFNFNLCQCRPDSRGSLTLRSPEAADKPVIRPNYLSAPNDRRTMIEASALARRIAATPPFAELVEEEIQPGPRVAGEAGFDAYIRSSAATVYHPCGTVRMGTDDHAPLDPELRVRGVDGLRVADASVFPLIPSANIHPATLMVAERAAELVRRG
jgi:choline dehydrogenase